MMRQAIRGPKGGASNLRKAAMSERSHGLRTTTVFACCFALAASLIWSAPASAAGRAAPFSFADLVEKLSPAVVNISTTQEVKTSSSRRPDVPTPQFPPGSPFEEFFKEFFERQDRDRGDRGERGATRRATSLGSGFIIDSAGIVVTNNHVIADADEIRVILNDDTTFDAEIVGRDPKTDLAVLKIKAPHSLPSVTWGNSNNSRVGDWILAIGNPYGLENTVTVGIISARGRVINAGPYDDFLQTDASINRGNSGGPMFNVDGEVIGINTAIFSPSGGSVGIGFAIPAALAKPLIDQLVEYGRPRRGWLGVRIQTVSDEIAEGLGLAEAKGALVAGVTDDGPAKGAGIEPGDVILTFDGKDVVEMRKLPRLVAETNIGKEVAVEVWRKGKLVTLGVTLGELPEDDQQVASIAPATPKASTESLEALGLTLSAITDELREKHTLGEATKGVVVTAVTDESPAAEKGIRPGDVIVEVSQEEVGSPGEVIEKVRKVQDSNRKSVLLLVQSGEDLRFVALRLDNS